MNIDISRVNLSEQDIEDWLFANPNAIERRGRGLVMPVVQWIGRQYPLPSGIADLVGVRANGTIVLVEIKNVPINKAAILQVLRYAADLDEIIADQPYIREGDPRISPHCEKIVVGPSIDAQTFYEAEMLGVSIIEFSASINVTLGYRRFSKEQHEARLEHLDRIASQNEWKFVGQAFYSDEARAALDERFEAGEFNEIIDEIVRKRDEGAA